MLKGFSATHFAKRTYCVNQLEYLNYGNPTEVCEKFFSRLPKLSERKETRLQTVKIKEVRLPDKTEANQVLVKWLACPINPADINQIQGVYPVKPPLPAVAGNEGVGMVEQIGSSVSNLQVGDLVIPNKSGLGTWREFGIHAQQEVFKIDKDLPLEYAAVLQVNPPTAYRMLKDFVNLKKGDTVIQNGGNSAVGKQVIQICRILGFKSVSVVRNRENLDDLVAELKSLGADQVITEEELYSRKYKFENVRLALNCVGGRSSLFLASVLARGGCMVTYGGMSKQPVQVPTGPMIFKDISLRGFWVSKWYDNQKSPEKRNEMYADLAEWMKNGDMKKLNFAKKNINDYITALDEAQNKFDKKQLFIFE